jgi:4-amino-4-deoxy-L-arabinose transferase-like glycosyltransferase
MAKKKQKQFIKNTAAAAEMVSFTDRYSHVLVAAILLLALIVRIAALIDLSGSIYADFLLWDERIYHEWAKKIAEGTFSSKTIYEFAPLFAYITAFIYKIASPDIFYVRILSIFSGVLTCWLVYLIGKELANKQVGLFACLIACLYKPFIFYSIVPLKEMSGVCLFAVTVYFFLTALNETPEKRRLKNGIQNSTVIDKWMSIKICSLGIAAGLLINIRPNAVILLPVIPFVMLFYLNKERVSLKRASLILIMYIAGIAVAVSPFIIRNYLVAGKVALTTSQAGFNLYLGNNLQNPDPYYRPVSFASSSPFEQGTQFTIEASRRVGGKLDPQEASDYWTKEILTMAVSEPVPFTRKLMQKTLVLFNQFEACDHYHIPFLSDFVKFFNIPFLSFWLILPLGMAGMIVSIFRQRATRGLAVITALYGLTLIVFFTSARYRLPLLVILIPFAAMAVWHLTSSIRKKVFRQTVLPGVIIVSFLIIEFLPVRATDDVTAYFNTHAIILDSKGFTNEAIMYWKTSSDMNKSFSAFANLALAGKYFQRGDLQSGNYYLNKIPDNSFAAASKYELFGDIMTHNNQLPEAISAYKKSLEINSGQRRVLAKLIHLYSSKDPQKAVQEEARLKYLSSFY